MKISIKLIINYFILIILFVLLLILSHSIPEKYLTSNVNKSAKTLQKEGLYPRILNFKLFQLDNYTDALMLNLAISVDSKNPVEASMINNYYHSNNFFDLAYDIEKVASSNFENLNKTSYGRYWQGYLVLLRPALCFLNYNQIRILNFLFLFTLLFLSGFLIAKKISKKVMLIFLISMTLINFPIIPLSMQFSTVFYISLISIIVILLFRKNIENRDTFLLLFFTIGGITSYLDFLTVPLVTLGLPLTIYILSSEIESNKIFLVIKGSLIWILGYGLLWASKWIIGGWITGEDILSNAIEAETLRTSNLYNGMEMTIPKIFEFIFQSFVQMQIVWLLWTGLIGFLIAICIYILLVKSIIAIKQNLYLLLIVAMVPIWYFVLRNHSIQHGWMTWRAIVVALFAGFIFILNTTSFIRIQTFFKTKKN